MTKPLPYINYLPKPQGLKECKDPRPKDLGVRVRHGTVSLVRSVGNTVSTATRRVGIAQLSGEPSWKTLVKTLKSYFSKKTQ